MPMKPSVRPVTKAARVVACLALLNFAVPGGALVSFGVPLKASVEAGLARRAKDAKDLARRRARSASRLLTPKEERTMQGRSGENPYLAGQSKWDVVYKGVDLMTGNYSTSATDLSFDGGYGIPVNVTRSYSANSVDEGPFGKGWTLSADVRSTAGGLLKSGSAPVRSVPTTVRERSSVEDDPNVSVEPVAAVTAVDAGGTEETVQKDVDGILTTPAWDKNVYDSVYEWVTLNGQKFQVLVSNTVKTPEGTVYTYAKKGTYPNGTVPWNNPGATPEAANILKVTSATDRQGNATTYLYGTPLMTFQKSNGTTSENPLIQVSMPGGHQITFFWGSNSSLASYNRITASSDGPGGRVVNYTYTGTAGHGLLASATSAGGKTTSYGYGSSSSPGGWSGAVATDLLTTITDPRGLAETVMYVMTSRPVAPFGGTATSPVVWQVQHSNGMYTHYFPQNAAGCSVTESNLPSTITTSPPQTPGTMTRWFANGYTLNSGTLTTSVTNFPRLHSQSNFIQGGADDIVYHTYDLGSQNEIKLYEQFTGSYPDPVVAQTYPNAAIQSLQTDKTFNFMGQPLTVAVTAKNGASTVAARTMAYAYWGSDKYFQQKAVQDQAGRYSYTDYYDKNAVAGKRGQTYRVYDPKNAGFVLDTSITPPAATPAANFWKYQLKPGSPTAYSAQFDYDAQGRPIDVWKLQRTSPSWVYVQTHTSYGADGSPTWGQAASVVEDYGGIGRTTQTNAYTSWGKASDVTDAAGHEFVTVFDKDGLVKSVTRTDVTPNVPVVTYAYGATAGAVSFGQPTSVTDGLSGVVQTIAYTGTGGGIGQPASVTETNGSDSYSTSYAYNPVGLRDTVAYSTPSGTTRWRYWDYATVGSFEKIQEVFTRLTRLDSAGNPTPEEFDYRYQGSGRLSEAYFAMTPSVSSASNGTWYANPALSASTRAMAHYDYDPEGRISALSHWWQVSNGNGYSSSQIAANTCAYENTGLNRGLKTSSAFSMTDGAGGYVNRTETYGYDASLDYLTSANYGDGNPNATPSWTYDAAGNRSDASVVDSLNRATTLGGAAVTNDILGNRLTKGGVTYGWDVLNRMTSLSGGVTASYAYRADGMRVGKSTGGVSTRYRHDGQMGFEDLEVQGATTTVTRSGLGARGVDFIERTVGGTVTTGFPIYDAHGNNVATLSRNGTGYSIGDRRSYDAWGVVRSQQSGGDPKLRYCAGLGHKQDDESGLVYMRARYYEPTSGRFVSEDSANQGINWCRYAGNDPVNQIDQSGKSPNFMYAMSLLGADYFKLMSQIAACLAMDKVTAIARLAEIKIEIQTDFESLIMTSWMSAELDAAEAVERGDVRRAELAQDQAAGIKITGRAMVASLRSTMNFVLLLKALEDQDADMN